MNRAPSSSRCVRLRVIPRGGGPAAVRRRSGDGEIRIPSLEYLASACADWQGRPRRERGTKQ
jgi:hypothetical protein